MKYVPMRHLSTVPIVNGLGLPGAFDDPSWPRYIRTTDIATPTTLRSDVFASQPPEVAVAAMVRRGDVLMTAAGSIGKSVRYDEDAPACFAGFLVRVRPLSDTHGRFLTYWCQSKPYWDQLATGAVRSTIDNFSAGRYRAMLVPQPPVDQQQQIVDYLDRETAQIDALIGKQERLIETLRECRAAAVSHACADATSIRVPLRRMVDVVDCAHVTAELVDDDQRFPVASIRECQGAEVNLARAVYTTEHFFELLRAGERTPRAGDLLFVRNVSVGLVAAVPERGPDFAVGQETVLLRRRAKVDPHFLRYALTGAEVRQEIDKAMIGSTFRRINVSAIRSLPVPLASLDEQERITQQLDVVCKSIDALIAKAEGFIALARERRSALITAAVTGQIDVRAAA